MPLKKGFTQKSIAHNIKAEVAAGRPQEQAVAIAMDIARKAREAAARRKK